MSAVSMVNLQRIGLSFQSFLALCKPRVTALIVFTAMIGMFLATPDIVPLGLLLAATLGIGMASGAAAAFNCLIEQKLDAKMARTRARPLPTGQVTSAQTVIFASVMGLLGLAILYFFVNPLTMWLTLATFVGYAVIYTIFLKPATPLNIVIGGASGAMPPILGWAAVNNVVSPESLILFLIIFAWTPPHFWSLALYRTEEYAKAGVPMLPVTHGAKSTRRHIFAYSLLLPPIAFAPVLTGLGGAIYAAVSIFGGAFFLFLAWRVLRSRAGEDDKAQDKPARDLFGFSILYLFVLFAALLVERGIGA